MMFYCAGKGVVEISSTLIGFLNRFDFESGVKDLLLLSDGCGGQNKNSNMVRALLNGVSKNNNDDISHLWPLIYAN